MSRVAILAFAILAATSAPAQQYTIASVAGGPPAPTPVPAVTAGIGSPRGVTTDAAGNTYFTSFNCVFKVDGNGTLTRVAGNFWNGSSGDGGPAASAQLNQPEGLAVDTAGNLYVADAWNNRVRKVAASGIITTVAGNGTRGFSGDGSPATSAQLDTPEGLAVDAAGNLYIADLHRVRRVSASGIITTVAGNGEAGFSGDGGPATGAQLMPIGVAVNAAGNLYIAESSRVRKVSSSGIITTIAGNDTAGFSGDGGPATSAQLNSVEGLAVDAAGNLYITETYNRVRKVSSNGIITTLAGNGTQGFSGDGGPVTSAQLSGPHGVAVDGAGNLYIADFYNCRVRKVSASGVITTIAGNGTYSFSGDGGPATAAQLYHPEGVAADTAANLYIADGNRLRKISASAIITTIAGGGSADPGDGGPATSARLRLLRGVTVDGAGNLYITEDTSYWYIYGFMRESWIYDSRVRRVSPSGVITTIAGGGKAGPGDGGPATGAQFYSGAGVAVDGAGSLYITDGWHNRVRKVSASGIITTVAGNGTEGFSGDGGPATSAQLDNPAGVAVDAPGNLYIADYANGRVRRVSASGIITTVAGGGSASPGDGGTATGARLYGPVSVAVDTAGNLYIADSDQHVRKVSSSGIINTIAGNGTAGFSGDGGPATSAQLCYPQAIAVDLTGRVYIADSNNNAIRVLQPVPAINASGIVNAASYTAAPPVAGSIAVLFGTNLAASLVGGSRNPPLKTSLGGVSVTVNGVSAPLFYVSPLQIAFQVPWETAGQSQVSVTVTNSGVTSAPVALPLSPVAPAIFSVNQQGNGQGSVLIANSDVIAAPSGSITGRTTNPVSRAAFPYISIYCTGLGDVYNAPATGQPASFALASPTKNTVMVTIGGVTVPALFSGLAPGFVGLYQVNAQVPQNVPPGDAVPVTVTAGGQTSNWVTIAVQ